MTFLMEDAIGKDRQISALLDHGMAQHLQPRGILRMNKMKDRLIENLLRRIPKQRLDGRGDIHNIPIQIFTCDDIRDILSEESEVFFTLAQIYLKLFAGEQRSNSDAVQPQNL